MMRLLFAHDNRFIPAGERVYSDGQFGKEAWARYLEHFSSLKVVGRLGVVPPGKDLTELYLASREQVSFEFFENLSSAKALLLHRKRVVAEMMRLVGECDGLVARLPSEIGLLAIRCAEAIGRPWAVEIVGCAWDGLWNYGTIAGKIYAPIYFYRNRLAIKKSAFSQYVTNKFLQGRYPANSLRSVAVSNVMLPDMDEDVLSKRLEYVSRRPVDAPFRLGLIGSLHGKFKGIQTVLEALKIGRETLSNVTFHVLGNGDTHPWYELAQTYGVQDRVKFHGTLASQSEVFAWLDQVDLYLQPSLNEGLPRALIEAMSRALPSLGSRVAGIPELLPQSDLFSPGDARALHDIIRTRMKDENWARTSAKRNFEEAKKYQLDVVSKVRSEFWKEFWQYCLLAQEGR